MKIFLICPVTVSTPQQKGKMNNYVEMLEREGHKVHFPPRDTNQDDDIGYQIMIENTDAIRDADEVHIFWDKNSVGSKFDMGAAFILKKPLVIVNPEDIEPKVGKAWENIIAEWSFRSESGTVR